VCAGIPVEWHDDDRSLGGPEERGGHVPDDLGSVPGSGVVSDDDRVGADLVAEPEQRTGDGPFAHDRLDPVAGLAGDRGRDPLLAQLRLAVVQEAHAVAERELLRRCHGVSGVDPTLHANPLHANPLHTHDPLRTDPLRTDPLHTELGHRPPERRRRRRRAVETDDQLGQPPFRVLRDALVPDLHVAPPSPAPYTAIRHRERSWEDLQPCRRDPAVGTVRTGGDVSVTMSP
jgi:hypothetical protein